MYKRQLPESQLHVQPPVIPPMDMECDDLGLNHDVKSAATVSACELPGDCNLSGEFSAERDLLNSTCEVVSQDLFNSTALSGSTVFELRGLQCKYDAVLESCAKLQDKLIESETEKSELSRSHVKLRDELTNAEVDKLELSDTAAKNEEKYEDNVQKCRALEKELESFKVKNKEFEACNEQLQEQAKLDNEKISKLEKELAKMSKCVVTLEQLQADDKMVSYYTGLSCCQIQCCSFSHC